MDSKVDYSVLSVEEIEEDAMEVKEMDFCDLLLHAEKRWLETEGDAEMRVTILRNFALFMKAIGISKDGIRDVICVITSGKAKGFVEDYRKEVAARQEEAVPN